MNPLPSLPRLLRAASALGLAALLASCTLLRADKDELARLASLRGEIAPHLEVLGARNWIVVADPTYPILAGEGIDVVKVDADAADTLGEVLDILVEQDNLKPRLWVCSELDVVPESRAPGVRRYRRDLRRLLKGELHYEVTDRIIALQLAQAAKTYRILYLKTNTPLPYSSIAIELDSGYWNSSDEAELRERIERLEAKAREKKPLPSVKPSDYVRPEA